MFAPSKVHCNHPENLLQMKRVMREPFRSSSFALCFLILMSVCVSMCLCSHMLHFSVMSKSSQCRCSPAAAVVTCADVACIWMSKSTWIAVHLCTHIHLVASNSGPKYPVDHSRSSVFILAYVQGRIHGLDIGGSK